jgi:hypothetical protein
MNSQSPADKPAAMSDSATTERMVTGEADPIDTGDRTQAELLLEIADSTEFFHTADETGFADITVNGHRECWPIRSRGFHRWLARQFYALTKGAPNTAALNQALAVCQARAHFDGPECEVHVRVAGADGRIYLARSDWMVGGLSTIRPSDFVVNRGCGHFRYPPRADQSTASDRSSMLAATSISFWSRGLAFQISVQPATTLAKYATRPPSDRRGSRLPPRICSLESKRDSRVNDFVHAA